MKTFKLAYFMFLFLTNSLLFGQNEALRKEIDKIIRYDTDIDYDKTPGFIIGILDNDSTYFLSFGTSKKGQNVSFIKDDIFEIGSVSKLFTSSLIRLAEEEGLLTLDEKVNENFPPEYRNPRLNDLQITDLVNHQSGLPLRPLFFGKKQKDGQDPYAEYQNSDLLKFYKNFVPSDKKFEYSHTNYALLELILEHKYKSSLQDVLAKKLLPTLGMEHTFIDFAETKNNILVPGYDRSMKVVAPWKYSSFRGSEGVKSCTSDMISFIKSHMNISQTKLDDVLGAGFTDEDFESFNDKLSINNGWHQVNRQNFKIFMHTGRTSGHNVFVGMVRETKTAVVIMANSSVGTGDLGFQVLRLINYNWKRDNS